ncbi:hypothetical protein SKAU_G00049410 [Synaphobranchus kaupii]|uniref:Uncharacterized protein n=1 Tax=Synaphobranchus kaupii TaxID=118154 RepID=A0A9Q1G3K5_SYNKA|nr:hypothetical protein SKAU_G00049410 [Synaphobranchus kaupii]
MLPGACVPLPEAEARHAICHVSSFGQPPAFSMNCNFFATMPAPVAPATNDTVAEEPHVTPGQQDPAAHGHMHHKLIHIHLHEASATGLLSESNESGEVPVVKRDAPADPGPPQGPPPEVMGPGIQLCPGRLRYF